LGRRALTVVALSRTSRLGDRHPVARNDDRSPRHRDPLLRAGAALLRRCHLSSRSTPRTSASGTSSARRKVSAAIARGARAGPRNIRLSGAVMGMCRSEVVSRFDEIVEFSGLSTFLDTPVKRYSSGMYMRLAFSVAAHLEPEVLLVDEVLAVGDAQFQKKCLG